MTPVVAAVLALVGILVLEVLVLLAASRGSMERIGLGLRTLFRVMGSAETAEKVRPLLEPPKPAPPPKPSGEPLRLLAVLQRDSRFLDFFMDDLGAAENEQILAFVKKMHPECQASLKDHLILEPVLPQPEGETVEVPPGFDPSAVRLLGNVTGQPPFRGTLVHRGWRVKEIKLQPPPAGQDEFVVQPAEVELQ
jgi:hypothetical protein